MNESLNRVRRSYDRTVADYHKGINPEKALPREFRGTPEFKAFLRDTGPALTGSGAIEYRQYLAPRKEMRFLDIGCCANLANYRLDLWEATYYGIDFSPELINAMKQFVKKNNIKIGGLHIAEAIHLPFQDNFFDIAAAIGVFEYCSIKYSQKALAEIHRVLKPGAKFIFDLPNPDHKYINVMYKVEEYLGRPNIRKPRDKFEMILSRLFNIDIIDDSLVMIKYFVKNRRNAEK